MTAAQCSGFRLQGVDAQSAAAFDYLCRVIDVKWSQIDAMTLFKLRYTISTEAGFQYYNTIFDGEHAAEAAAAFSLATRCHKNFGHLYEADPQLAGRLAQHAALVNAAKGGMYRGQLVCLRSTLCDPRLGVDDGGCCLACQLIRTDTGYQRRLSRRVSSDRDTGTSASTAKRTLKCCMFMLSAL